MSKVEMIEANRNSNFGTSVVVEAVMEIIGASDMSRREKKAVRKRVRMYVGPGPHSHEEASDLLADARDGKVPGEPRYFLFEPAEWSDGSWGEGKPVSFEPVEEVSEDEAREIVRGQWQADRDPNRERTKYVFGYFGNLPERLPEDGVLTFDGSIPAPAECRISHGHQPPGKQWKCFAPPEMESAG